MMPPVSNRGNSKRRYACVECRQQKAKCDYNENRPNPCSNCAKKGIHCEIKKEFKRSSKRAKAIAMERKLSYLTSHLVTKQDINLNDLDDTSLKPTSITSQLWNNLPIINSDNILFTKEQLDILKLETKRHNFALNPPTITTLSPDKLVCTPKVLGDISMSSDEIADLFQEYVTKYHHFLPIVDLSKGVESLYKLSPCLFWVIISTALRRKPDRFELLTKLSFLVKSVLAEIAISPIVQYSPTETDEPLLNVASVYSVQAFLIYTFWPPLTSSLSADTSWNTCGTAMFQAVRVGLNSATFAKESPTTNPQLTRDQYKTWVSCNIVSQIVASSFGFPSYVSFGHSVLDSTKDKRSLINNTNISTGIELSPELRQMEQIVHFENQVQATLHSNPANCVGLVETQERIPLIMVLEQSLDRLEISLNDSKNGKPSIDSIRYFQLLLARVHLLTYFFIEDSVDKIDFELKRGLVKVYNAAIVLLEHTQFMCNDNPDIIKYFPGVFLLRIWQSSCIVCKLVHSSLNSILDVKRGVIAYQHAIQMTSKASIAEYDTAYRFFGIMKSIWNVLKHIFEKKDEEEALSSDFNLTVTIKSRMSASVFFDCLYILKQRCNETILERGSASNEYDARQIIKTTPLDPHPINASSSGGKNGSMLNSLTNSSRKYTSSNSLCLAKDSPSELDSFAVIKSASMPPSIIHSLPLLASDNYERHQSQSINNNFNELLRDTWDIGDMNFHLKDLDLLLNDFAFNPSL